MLVKKDKRKYKYKESRFHRWIKLVFDRLGISRYIIPKRPQEQEFPIIPFSNTPQPIIFYMDFIPQKRYGGLIKKNVSKERQKKTTNI